MNAPCRGCTDREMGCHGKCDKYKEYKEKSDKRREAEFFEKEAQRTPGRYKSRQKGKYGWDHIR